MLFMTRDYRLRMRNTIARNLFAELSEPLVKSVIGKVHVI